MNKVVSYKRQVLKVDMTFALATGVYTLEEEIAPYCKRVSHLAIYTKTGESIDFKNCRLFSPLKINDREVLPEHFDTLHLSPVPGSSCQRYQRMDVPVQNGSRIKARFLNPEGATALIIVLQLEKL